jgi:hypothetical protein
VPSLPAGVPVKKWLIASSESMKRSPFRDWRRFYDVVAENQTVRDKKITVQILSNSAFIQSSRAGIMPTLFHTLSSV